VFALGALVALLIAASRTGDRWRVGSFAVYGAALLELYVVSTLYHAVKGRAKRILRRLDHTSIYVLIAGTYTPFALLAFEGKLADAILIVVWSGAAAGLVLNLFWVDAPTWLTALVFVALGWVGIVAVPELLDLGVAPAVLVFVGGGLYTVGALAYAFKRPNPAPATFGYHEIFHLFVICAAAVHFIAIAAFVLPQS
jgi:hemolysin III